MRAENIIMYSSSVLLFALILISYKFSRRFGLVNTIVFILYNSFLYYLFIFRGSGGSSLLWLFYLAILTSVQLLIVLIFVMRRWVKKPRG